MPTFVGDITRASAIHVASTITSAVNAVENIASSSAREISHSHGVFELPCQIVSEIAPTHRLSIQRWGCLFLYVTVLLTACNV